MSGAHYEAVGVSRRFGAVQALTTVDVAFAAGEVHAVLGENGAGKSTLLRVLSGRLAPTAGALTLGGAAVRWRGAQDAARAGIGLVPQHLSIIPDFTALENLWFALAPGTPRRAAAEALEAYAPGISPHTPARDLSLGQRQAIELARVLASKARVVLLDEPTAVLAPVEAEGLYARVAALRAAGKAVVFVTHKLADVRATADRVTVLRQGRVTGRFAPPFDDAALVQAVVGADGQSIPAVARPHGISPIGRQVVTWRGRLRPGAPESSLALREGELLAVVGVDGNGQRELAAALLGLAPALSLEQNVARPWAYIPEDRQTEGLVLDWPLRDNLLPRHESALMPAGGAGSFSLSRATAPAAALLRRFDVRPPDPHVAAAALSGGNQQKVVLARELGLGEPRWVLAVNPSRGLDFRATADLHARLREARAAGLGVVLVTMDLDEALALGDRFAVLHAGALRDAGDRPGRERLGRMMTGSAA